VDRVRSLTVVIITLVAQLMFAPAHAVGLVATTKRAHGATPGLADQIAPGSDARELSRTHFTFAGHPLPSAHYQARPEPRAATPGTPPVGAVREWLGLDDTTGSFYRKSYTLRAVGKYTEVWVAKDTAFPAADCRKDSTNVTDAQIGELVSDFDDTIYPRETAAFSTPPDRDGANAALTGNFTGDGAKTVTLVDNIRDDNYYHFPQAVTYTAGFFSPQLNELVDRNVVTIDAYDWTHRLGANPANDPTADPCTNFPAHPRMYDGTFAHEWQHLLEYYQDPAEVTWVNEGLSDFAQTMVGYVDARATVYDPGADTQIACFQGFATVKTKYNPNPRECGGPQNSLNLWNEGAPSEVLADYGNAYSFMIYLRDRFGLATISKLHRDGKNHGLAGVQAALPAGVGLYDVLHDFQTMTLVDGIVGDGGTMRGVPIARVTAPELHSTVNLDNPAAYDTPGAAPNGADYVPLPTPLRSVVFQGAKYLPALPTGWTVADDTLFSGNRNDLDSDAVLPITVPAKITTLKLQTAFTTEVYRDYGYVTVSTDGGKSYTTLSGDRTVAGLLGPGLTGDSGGAVTAGYDLSAYAGQHVLLGLRYVSDSAVNLGGWRIGGITLGDQQVSDGSTLDGWKSPTAIVPTAVSGWHASLIGIDGNTARLVPVSKFARLRAYPKVVAVIAYDEPTETIKQYAPYTLTVNGKLQPGGL
jgi:hypothetical protein